MDYKISLSPETVTFKKLNHNEYFYTLPYRDDVYVKISNSNGDNAIQIDSFSICSISPDTQVFRVKQTSPAIFTRV